MHKARSSPPTFRVAGTKFRERITHGRNFSKKKINIPATDHIFNNDLQDRLGAEAMTRMVSHFDHSHDIAIANPRHGWASLKENPVQGLLGRSTRSTKEFGMKWSNLLANSKLVSGLLKSASLLHKSQGCWLRDKNKGKGRKEVKERGEEWILEEGKLVVLGGELEREGIE